MIKCIRNYHLREDGWMRLDLHAPACAYHQKILNNQSGGAGSYPHSGRCKHISEFHVVSLPKVETPSPLGFRSTLGMWPWLQCGQRPELELSSAPLLSSGYFYVSGLSDIYKRRERPLAYCVFNSLGQFGVSRDQGFANKDLQQPGCHLPPILL